MSAKFADPGSGRSHSTKSTNDANWFRKKYYTISKLTSDETPHNERQDLARIDKLGPGKAFMAKDFLDIASRGSIDVALTSLTSAGKIRRIRRGLYDLPIVNPDLGGELSPDIDEAARTIARRNRWTIIPEGPWAANLVGLSTQVPATGWRFL